MQQSREGLQHPSKDSSLSLVLPYKAEKETTATLIKLQHNLWHNLCYSIPDRMMLTQRQTAYRREQCSVLFVVVDLKSDTEKNITGIFLLALRVCEHRLALY